MLTGSQRAYNYYRQNGAHKLTPKQKRRIEHKFNRFIKH